jgi:hypothetical protein
MTVYIEPDFEIEALDLSHVPDQKEIYPDDDTYWLDPFDAELRLVGTRRKYRVGIRIYEVDGGTIGAKIWTSSDTANENLVDHAKAEGKLKVTVGLISFSANIVSSQHSDEASIADLFRHQPATWGLRGDPLLWSDMRDYFIDTWLPGSIQILEKRISDAFQLLTGSSIQSERPIFLPRYDTGGMSSGHVSPEFWRNQALEHLRLQLAYDKGMSRPRCPSCESEEVAKITHGYPGLEMLEALDRGEIVLGGCCVTEDDPEWHCKDCEYEW